MPYIKGVDRGQMSINPECLDDYVSKNNVVRVIDIYVEQLDVKKLGFEKAECAQVGRPPYNPKDLLKLYIYGYLNRVRSSRKLEDEASRNIEVMWLLNKLKPDFKTIADFRKDNKKALIEVFREFNGLCSHWDLYGKDLVAVDGTKIRACNSKKNNFNNKKLDRHIKYIEEKISTYMSELEESDKAEIHDRKPDVEEINQRIEELRKRKEKYVDYKKRLEESGETEISTVDPDARLMSTNNNGVEVSYNVQTTVDAKHSLIVDFKATQKPNDIAELGDMAVRTKEIFDGKDFEVLADKGYYKAEELKKCVDNGITPYVTKQTYGNRVGDKDFYASNFRYDKEQDKYICPAGKELTFYEYQRIDNQIAGRKYRNSKACKSCEFKERCTKNVRGRTILRHKDQDFLDTIDLATQMNMDKYRRRQEIIEHTFGTIKRTWGAYYFLTKRIASISAEISISFLAYNLRRVINILGVEEILKKMRERKNPVLN